MGRKRKIAKTVQVGSQSVENSLLNSTVSSEGNNDVASLKTLADDFAKMLTILTENGKKLDSINDSIKMLENRMVSVENTQSELKSEVNTTSSRVTQLESDVLSLRNQMSIIASATKKYETGSADLSRRLMASEYRHTETNIIVWNAPCENTTQAETFFDQLCLEGLGLSMVPRFRVVGSVRKEQPYFKVDVGSRDAKVSVLKNGKKLKGKVIGHHRNVSVSDDAPISVREARRKLYVKKSRLNAIGVSSWVSNTVPPYIQIDRGGVAAKFGYDEPIPELCDQ